MIEPQLENINDKNDNMIKATNKICNSQAQWTDYYNSSYKQCNRGHLFPSFYGSSSDERSSTFTLTNIVPQNEDFNGGSWKKMEHCVKCILDKYCNNKEGFVVIRAQPSSGNLLKNKINIPSKLWSAFCCKSDSEKKWLAGAYWGDNKAGITMDLKPLKELHKDMGKNFEVFPGGLCPPDTHLYSKLDPSCSCPKSKKGI
ncbi:unnamed protein product [Oreochromis niloticus]|nr:unnamed protein product [Mustela putorius furo]